MKKSGFVFRKQSLVVVFLLLIVGVSCKKKDENNPPQVTTTSVSNITTSSAISGGNVTSDGGDPVTARGICWSTSKTPTISDSKTQDETGTGAFVSNITGLSPNTTYYVRAYATNVIGTSYGSEISFQTITCSSVIGSFTDARDSNTYKTVTIGNQIWMDENLKYLPAVDSSAILSKTTPHYYVYDYQGNNVNVAKAPLNYQVYGVLYNWEASKSVCPSGWHLPSFDEWNELIIYLGDYPIAGGKLKETGTIHWNTSNTGATDEVCFTALPGGSSLTSFTLIGDDGNWWTSTEHSIDYAKATILHHDSERLSRTDATKEFGFSVRCIKD